jgi:hypothetical protein
MAYVVARHNGRFEIRESQHTPSGPRARSLAGFRVLTDEVIARASGRARGPFDVAAVLASGRRAGAPVAAGATEASQWFVRASRRMASSLRGAPAPGRPDPGRSLIDLLGFADAVRSSLPPRPFEPLAFPPLSRLVQARLATTQAS